MAVPSLEEQAQTLLTWKATLESQPAELQSWKNSTWPCSWHGITCGKHQARYNNQARFPVITGLSLRGLRLRGELDTLNFTVLATMTSIQLAHNQLRGSFPPTLASSLPKLHHLMLQPPGE
jgi:hypothetical protein